MDIDQRNSIAPEYFNVERRTDLHLDSQYSDRYLLCHHFDGTIEDTRKTNWNHIQWEKLAYIQIELAGHSYCCNPYPRNHQFFLHYRTYGIEKQWRPEEGRYFPKMLQLWTVGACDGQNAFLIDYDFHCGTEVMAHIRPLHEVEGHIHPRIKALNSIQKRYQASGNVVNLLHAK